MFCIGFPTTPTTGTPYTDQIAPNFVVQSRLQPSRQQRSDVIQEYNNVVLEFRDWCDGRDVVSKLLQELHDSDWIYRVIDHTAVPVTFGHLLAPAPHVNEDVSVNCPECRHAFTVPKSAAAGAKRLRGE